MPAGLPPAPTIVGADIAAVLEAEPDLLKVPAARLRASDALMCARRLGFRLFGTPPDIADDWDPDVRARGQAIDRLAKDVLRRRYDAQTDVAFSFLPKYPLEGIGDAVYTHTDAAGVPHVTAVEVKSTRARKLMGLVGNWRNQPAGPEAAYIAQAGMLALAVGAERIHIIVVPSDDDECRHRPAEWVIDMDGPLDHLPVRRVDGTPETPRHLSVAEVKRQTTVLDVVDHGVLPSRALPGWNGIVQHPPGRGDDGAAPWQCKFCPHQPTCARLPAGEVPEFARPAPSTGLTLNALQGFVAGAQSAAGSA